MGTPRNAGGGHRLRTGGLALFGLAAVAAVIGLALAVHHAEQTTAAAPPTVAAANAPASPRPSVIAFPPPVVSSPAEAPGTPAPALPPEAGEPAQAGGNAWRGDVRIYNNSTIRGLAARASHDFSAAGWTVVEVGNFARGTIPTTTVYYQEGTNERAEAEAIAAQFGMRAEPRFPGISSIGPGVIVIVTKDYAH
ncbi:MAG TPA: LytR C-terminal domain-containing protein [Pseudonocardiaceae bacterium]|nr:LytR C-terminal domain-containing protein [Pseudonocardiaceae bacterium]